MHENRSVATPPVQYWKSVIDRRNRSMLHPSCVVMVLAGIAILTAPLILGFSVSLPHVTVASPRTQTIASSSRLAFSSPAKAAAVTRTRSTTVSYDNNDNPTNTTATSSINNCNSNTNNSTRSLAEDRVVTSIQNILHNARKRQPKETIKALFSFGNATGNLVVQSWLTPQTLEECASFWIEGSSVFAIDLQRLRFPKSSQEAAAVGWFTLLAANTFPWTPLLLPLVDRALEDVDPSVYLPTAFGQERRRGAWNRLQLQKEKSDAVPHSTNQQQTPPGEVATTGDRELFRTPQNVEESMRFFTDGSLLLLRDFQRGRLLQENQESLSTFGWFTFLSFSTFPLTPLLLPLIDKRRKGGTQSDYVPSAFRARRLAAMVRLREKQYKSTNEMPPDPIETLRAAAEIYQEDRPSTKQLLSAIIDVQRKRLDNSDFQDNLAGGGSPGRQWKLVYTAGKGAVIAARGSMNRKEEKKSWFGADLFSKLQFPWSNGLYVDGFAKAVQRFDTETYENENGFFGLLGQDEASFTVVGPFKWDLKSSICAFQPTATRLAWNKDLKWEFPITEKNDEPPKPLFEETKVSKLPFFKFILVDDAVAVAQGRSGGVALWARIEE